jgi:SAM-dependent methyltransferase
MNSDLSSRVTNEKAAYNDGDVYARSAQLQRRFSHVFLCPNAVFTDRLFDSTLADVAQGRFVLDYGCFNGWSIPALASCAPRRILGIDISENAIAEAKLNHGTVADFGVMDCHRLALAEESLDVVVGRAILHHLDFDTAIREIRRVLKPGGHAVFIEPLRDNPAGKLVRLLTPRARTRDELPLSRAQIRCADKLFSESRHFFSGLVSVGCGMVSSLVSRSPANAVMRLAHRLDLKLASSPLKWWMRMVVLCWTK